MLKVFRTPVGNLHQAVAPKQHFFRRIFLFFAVKSKKRNDQNPQGAGVLLGLAAKPVFVLLTIVLAGTERWEEGWALAATLRWSGVRVGDAEEVCHIQSRCCGLRTASRGSGVLPVAAHRVLLFHEHPNAVPSSCQLYQEVLHW